MEFSVMYIKAMREQAPRMFNQLVRAGKMNSFAKAKSKEANELKAELLASRPKDSEGRYSLSDEHRAEEIVRAQLIEFPQEKKPDRLEPPEDLPQHDRMPVSRA